MDGQRTIAIHISRYPLTIPGGAEDKSWGNAPMFNNCSLYTVKIHRNKMLAINVSIPMQHNSRPPGAVPIAATTNPGKTTNRRRG